jgi:hypothetical protein
MRVLFCPPITTFVRQQKMNTFVCHLAPKLYHDFAARVKHCYKLLQLGVVFLPPGTILAPRAKRESFSFAFAYACMRI